MHEIGKVPARHVAGPLVADLVEVVLSEKLHAHDGENEDDDAQDERQVGEGADRVGHDCEDVVERLPRLRQLEDSQQTERSQHGQALHALGQQLDQGENDNQEIEAIPSVLKLKKNI